MDKVTLEFILWTDPWSHDQWDEIQNIPDHEYIVHTYGQVIKEDELTITITLNYVPSEEKASCTMIIPKCCIKQRFQIEGYGRDKIRDDL